MALCRPQGVAASRRRNLPYGFRRLANALLTSLDNEFVAPTLVPDPAFATLFHSSLQEWIECPQTIQDIWVLLTKQFRAIQANITPDSDKEICRYRDRSINGLNRLLANPETQLCDETLDAIIMLLMAEVSASSIVNKGGA